jgi:hypothetical protein
MTSSTPKYGCRKGDRRVHQGLAAAKMDFYDTNALLHEMPTEGVAGQTRPHARCNHTVRFSPSLEHLVLLPVWNMRGED